jgi:ketosteroid isomerase-like protein
MTPKEFLKSYVEKFNAKNVSSLIDMYETDACFQVQPGQVVKGLENIRQSLQGFIDLKGNLQSNVKGVIQASNLALVNTEWLFSGTAINIGGKAIDVLRQQSDGTWRIVIDNPWGSGI